MSFTILSRISGPRLHILFNISPTFSEAIDEFFTILNERNIISIKMSWFTLLFDQWIEALQSLLVCFREFCWSSSVIQSLGSFRVLLPNQEDSNKKELIYIKAFWDFLILEAIVVGIFRFFDTQTLKFPRLGLNFPANICIAVDFPIPFVPTNPRILPRLGVGKRCNLNEFGP